MKQLNIAATFAAATVLTVFTRTCWVVDGQPFEQVDHRFRFEDVD